MCSRGTLAAALLAAALLAGCGSAGSPAPRDTTAKHVVGLDPSAGDLARARRAARVRSQRGRRTTRAGAAAPGRPRIEQTRIPFPPKRREEMAAYARRHYGLDTYRLTHPKVIVEHYTESADAQSAIDLFSPDTPDQELHELPNVCAHFVIDRDGTIHQLVPLTIMCRHTVGLNYTAIGIEHAGFSDAEILRNRAELAASLKLTTWLRCRFGIDVKNVIGHNESLSSPYHREKVASLRTQTHADWSKADMDVYRRRLAGRACA
ncbi:MAG: N-acetylmuramoyl-L-alanine amidase [Thermoleophilaceae bacterium]